MYSQSSLSFLKLLILRFNWKYFGIEGVQFYPISLSFSLGKELAVVEKGLFNLLNHYIHREWWGRESEQQNGKGMKYPLPIHQPTDLLAHAPAWGKLCLMRFLSNSKCPSGESSGSHYWVSRPVSIGVWYMFVHWVFLVSVCMCVFCRTLLALYTIPQDGWWNYYEGNKVVVDRKAQWGGCQFPSSSNQLMLEGK